MWDTNSINSIKGQTVVLVKFFLSLNLKRSQKRDFKNIKKYWLTFLMLLRKKFSFSSGKRTKIGHCYIVQINKFSKKKFLAVFLYDGFNKNNKTLFKRNAKETN